MGLLKYRLFNIKTRHLKIEFLMLKNDFGIILEIVLADIVIVFNIDAKLEALKLEILRTFDELYKSLVERRDNLLSRLDRIKKGHDRNVELEEAISQLKITINTIQGTMVSNLVGQSLDAIKEKLDRDIELRTAEKVAVENLELVEFRCFSGRIRMAIERLI